MLKKRKNKITKHEEALKNDIFFTKKRWPHFNLLFNDMVYRLTVNTLSSS